MYRAPWLAAALVGPALLVAACGTGDSEGSPSPAEPDRTTNSAQAAGSPGTGTASATIRADGTPVSSPTPAQKTDLCGYLPKSFADAIFPGATLQPGRATGLQVMDDGSDLGTCTYQAADGRQAVTLVIRWTDPARAKAGYLAARAQAVSPVDVPGLGEQAFWWPNEGQLNAVAGGNWVILRLVDRDGGSRAQPPAPAVAAMGEVLAELR